MYHQNREGFVSQGEFGHQGGYGNQVPQPLQKQYGPGNQNLLVDGYIGYIN